MGIFDNLFKSNIDNLLKQEDLGGDGANNVPDEPVDVEKSHGDIARQAIIHDPYYDQFGNNTLFKNRSSRLSNKTLKDVSVRDWVVSSILQARADTIMRFGRPQLNRFDFGFKVQKKDRHSDCSKEELEEIRNIEDFIYRCGRTTNVPHDDKMLFNHFLKLVVRDALTFGHIAVEKVKTKSGGLHRFRPLPAESVYLVNRTTSKKDLDQHIKALTKETIIPSDNNPEQHQEQNEVENDYYKYIQMSVDERPLAVFGDEDMVWKLFNPQNFADSRGYCYSTLELAIINITNHLNVENYNANFFTHGYAARGLLHLKGTVTQSQLTAFRRQFYNTISGAQHAWRTPIISGLDEVQWVQMSGNAKEMEYINFNDHLIRSLCSQFQIDPSELGLDHLTSGKNTGAGSSNEEKIEYSRERGLYPILMFVEDFINSDILPGLSPEIAAKYTFTFEGYTEETPQTEIAQLQAEMSVYSSMNDLLKKADKEKMDEEVADLPLNEAFWGLIEKNYTRGEIRERFFGDKGASKVPEFQYIPGDPAFIGWSQMLLTIDGQKKQEKAQQEQMQQEQAQQEQQQEAEQQQADQDHSRDQEKHEADMEKHGAEMQDRSDSRAHAVSEHAKSLKDIAKESGAATKPLEIGGKAVANPINVMPEADE